MNALQAVLWLVFCGCLGIVCGTGIINGVALLALIALGALVASTSPVRAYFRSLSAPDPTSQRSVLDVLDRPAPGRPDDRQQ